MNTSTTLGALIQERRNSNGWSYRDLETRSPAGTGLNKSRWGELARDEVKTFSGDQLRGIAQALSLPEHVIGRAALTSMGLPSSSASARTLEDAVRTDYNLTDHDRRIILAVLREMRTELIHEQHPQGQPEPRTETSSTQPTQPSPITRAGASLAKENIPGNIPAPEDEVVPMPDELALAADDTVSEGRGRRAKQDDAAEESQDHGD